MKATKSLLSALFITTVITGCSSVPMPSLPSGSWFSSAPKPDPSAEGLFKDGTRAFNEKKYARAIEAFNRLIADYPFSPLLIEAQLKAADAYYLNQQYPEAISAFKEFQSMHPSNENIPFVVYRLGLSYFDQFTSVDRDQKDTKTAKDYFESVITKYPQSPYASQARVKLAKCVEYLSDHDYQIATFYLKQENYPAARDRFEEILRRYPDTPASVRSLFYLGESYKHEKNSVKAALAYEALIQHYPQSQFAAQARTELASLEKQKIDPLAMLLMRDRRPGSAPAPVQTPDSAVSKLKNIELIAKTEVVHEEPGAEKGFFSRVIDKVNPFTSSDSDSNSDSKPVREKDPENWQTLVLKNKNNGKEDSPGILSWLNPFSSSDGKSNKKNDDPKNTQSVAERVDDSLGEKGIDANSQIAGLKPPPTALPDIPDSEVRDASPKTTDVATLIGQVDSSLKENGKSADNLPARPEVAEVFKDPALAQQIVAKAKASNSKELPVSQNATDSGILSSIDQKLNAEGIMPGDIKPPPAPVEQKAEAKKSTPVKAVELEPKVSVEKGPLFLAPADVKTAADSAPAKDTVKPEVAEKEPEFHEVPKSLVRGPNPSQTASIAPKKPEKKSSEPGQEEEKGPLDQLKSDIDALNKALNPFSW